ncbi:thiol reductant ABC exporter subunit CydC [Azospirillum sp. A39]|uniref:thiol reductant ABC exporter subunit CydC n=1 Tax=Azospirillum sp. A39 TaxID=3462279 RepID=UPI0040465B6A
MTRLVFLLALTRGHRAWMLAGLGLAVVTALANIALMAVSGWFITGMAVAGASAAPFNYFLPAALIRGCAIVRTAGRYLERLATHEATFRLIGTLRPVLFLALAPRLPFGLPGAHSGDLAARLGADLDRLQQVYLRVGVPVATAALVGGAVVAWAAAVAPAAAIVLACGLMAGGVLLPGVLARAGRPPGRDAIVATDRLRTGTIDFAQGLEELHAFGATARHGAQRAGAHDRLAAAQRRSARQEAVGTAAGQTLGTLVLWAVVLTVAPAVAAGTLAAPDLAMLAFLSLAVVEVTAPLAGAFQAWGATAAATDRLRPLLAVPPAAAAPPDRAAAPPAGAPPHIRLDTVEVRYPGVSAPALRGLTLDLPPGARVALVGASGSGKSTVVALLAGFLAAERGRLLLDGKPVARGDTGRLAAMLSVAPQTPHLLAGSVRRNLLVAAPDATDAALIEACERATLGPWLAGLPDGLDTAVGEGGRPLSGGEARRLAVARALLTPAPVLVLDEPGEGLDPATERRLIERALADRPRRTVLLITHRPAGLEHMDHVVVLDRGRVLEQGTPWSLVRHDGPFRRFLERCFV